MKRLLLLFLFASITLTSNAQELRITEIMYNPNNSDSSWEWIEVYNVGNELVDLSGFVLDDNGGAAYTEANIPEGTIPSGESAILFNASALSENEFLEVWGTVNLIAVTRWSALNNTGDTIGIWSSFEMYTGDNSSQENVIEQVVYDDDGEIWPEDDGSASIYLTDLNADSSVGANWSLSTVGDETPLFSVYTSMVFENNDGVDIGSPGLSASIDMEKPIITCPDDINMMSAEDNCGSNFPLVLPTATDNVSTELLLQGVRDDGLDLGESFPVGVTSVTWTATDEAGNVSESCVQIILITDDVDPVINCAENVQAISQDGNPVSLEIGFATATNVCDGELTLEWARSDEQDIQEPFPVGTTTIVWTAIDESDNIAMCTQSVTVSFEQSEENSITSFYIPNQTQETIIDAELKTVVVKVPFGTDVTNLVPEVQVSEDATFTPSTETGQDFTNPVAYIVTAQNGLEQIWIVSIMVEEEIDEEEETEEEEISISSFMLINADTNEELFELEEGMAIEIDALPTLHLDIRAIASENVESVQFSLMGVLNSSRIENIAPYALFGDSPLGNYLGNDFIEGTYTLSATPYSEDNVSGNIGESQSISFEFINEPAIVVTDFMLVNADTNEDLFILSEGMRIDVNSLSTLNLDIRANTSENVESMQLKLEGNLENLRTENLAPYALYGDFPSGSYNGETFTEGTYTISATPYSLDGLQGDKGNSLSINFEIINNVPELSVISFTLVNADTNEDIFELENDMLIDISILPTLNLDIRANATSDAESVQLSLTGNQTVSRTENLAPYALFGDFPVGNYNGHTFEIGEYNLTASAFSENNLGGEMGDALSMSFIVTESQQSAKHNDQMSVYQNKATSKAIVQFKTPKNLPVIYLYDVLGRVVEVYKGNQVLSGEDYILNTATIPEGNYFINTRDDNGILYQKQILIRK